MKKERDCKIIEKREKLPESALLVYCERSGFHVSGTALVELPPAPVWFPELFASLLAGSSEQEALESCLKKIKGLNLEDLFPTTGPGQVPAVPQKK